ncbi:DNA-dependent metalloprotease SPRTN isoform X2 [Anolis carolinensis]|uniref:DNA-dependent metalloprotease SPRTN n=1 Tax=Anolis carolinensis TaxID=28377 RepID=G1KB79_ANOCA|nr:PREDICTED: sprT-like domain-containing protein Spartan isoform X2 [Anolis carolinensis]|eukprot:XP_008122534.1 PREDICTED: sprT-like domain-containing protein Spartan isoform X2 [Anolis carolinensis]
MRRDLNTVGSTRGCASMDGDFLLALRLQEEWNSEEGERAASLKAASSPARPLSLVDESWELLDPSPDVRGLFVQFNQSLFWGALEAVEVKWSPRMTLCAGVCCYEGRGGMCSIRLSEPLLKLRPRKDLVETLLHEMIHALLFVTYNNKDHDSHGPEFCKHMDRINRLTGTNITVYHNFHDEVDFYRQHWWRCNGPCQKRMPYFGYVKRAINRAPSANDYWWSDHQQTCGGTFTKIKEPENYAKKDKEKNSQAEVPANGKGITDGKNIQSIIPFSGKGYVLGRKSDMTSSEKTTSPSNNKRSRYHSPSDLTRKNPKNEDNFSFTNVPPSFSSIEDKNNFTSRLMLPKVSVANKKVYRNVNGSPIKNVLFTERRSNSSFTNDTSEPLSKETPEKSIFQPTTSTPKSYIASHGNDSPQNGGASKRARMEDTTAFENYFIKKKPLVKSEAEPAAIKTVTPSVSNQKKKVRCPVCQSEVLEANINEHLDVCL